jgi:hypothetical protein
MSCCDGWRERAYGSRAADWRDLISVCYWSKIPYGHSRGEETQVPKMPKLAMEKLCLRLGQQRVTSALDGPVIALVPAG